jgi:hypothetical protein
MLPIIPQDKANHFIYGSVIFTGLVILANFLGLNPIIFGFVGTTLIAATKELVDYIQNKRAILNNILPSHGVEFMDFIATISGSIPQAIILLL